MRTIKYCGWCLVLLAGCRSDTERLRDVEHRFVRMIARPGVFSVFAGGDTLFLPVLPAPESIRAVREEAADLQEKIKKIDLQALDISDQKRLGRLQQAVAEITEKGFSIPADQVCTRIHEPFEQALNRNNEELTLRFVAHLPDYFSEMEQRWQAPSPMKINESVQAAQHALLALDRLEQQTSPDLRNEFTQARRALKDYLGLCQSAILN